MPSAFGRSEVPCVCFSGRACNQCTKSNCNGAAGNPRRQDRPPSTLHRVGSGAGRPGHALPPSPPRSERPGGHDADWRNTSRNCLADAFRRQDALRLRCSPPHALGVVGFFFDLAGGRAANRVGIAVYLSSRPFSGSAWSIMTA